MESASDSENPKGIYIAALRLIAKQLLVLQLFQILADLFLDLYHAEGLQLGFAEDFYALVVVHFNLDFAGKEAAFDNNTPALGSIHDGIYLGEGGIFTFIGILLEAQTAHQPSAGTAYL